MQSEYENEYDLSARKQFSTPKIYTANGNLKQRWYVYFSYRNPETDRLMRQPPIYANANRFRTKEERMAILSVYYSEPESKNKNWQLLNDILNKMAKEDKNLYIISSTGLISNPDHVHFNSVSQRMLGKRFATKYLEEVYQKD